MTQAANYSVPRIGPATPTVMAGRIDDSFDALLSAHSGAARPSYAVAGTVWMSTATAGFHKYYFFDGTNDHLVVTINTTTGAVTYSGGAFAGAVDLQGFALSNPAGEFLRGNLSALTLANNATDAVNDIDIAAGSAASDGAIPVLMTLAASMTKRLDAAWAVGTNQGGLDTGAIANTTYHLWLIQRSDTGVVDVLFSASATAPTMPASYDRKRRIGAIVRSGGAIKPFFQDGDDFSFVTASVDITAVNPTTAAVTRTVNVPVGVRVEAKLKIGVQNTAGGGEVYVSVSDLSKADETPARNWSDIAGAFFNTGGSIASWASKRVRTNTSAQVRSHCNFSDGNTTLYIYSEGWIDTRGRI